MATKEAVVEALKEVSYPGFSRDIVSFGIVQRHGGTIRVQSEVGRGSAFTIWIPIEGKGE